MRINLSTKFTLIYIIISSVLFAVSAFWIYHFIRREVDEKVVWKLEADHDRIMDMVSDSTLAAGNLNVHDIEEQISQRYISIKPAGHHTKEKKEIKDTLMATRIFGGISQRPYMQMRFHVQVDSHMYEAVIRQQRVETHDLKEGIINPLVYVFIALTGLLTFINFLISKRVWSPFYATIHKMTAYQLTGKQELRLTDSRVREFQALNESVASMAGKIRKDYLNLKEFTENMAHEIQTPLAVMMTKIELLMQSENLTAQQSEFISSLNESIRKLNRLNQSLILIARIENAQFLNREKVFLKEKIDSLLNLFEDMLAARNLSGNLDLDPDVFLEMEPTLAEVLLTNLISNAIKHAIPGTAIEVALTGEHLVIANDGQPYEGNPEDLFNRFKNGRTGQGSLGLGLSITKSICDYYKLEISYRVDGNRHILKIDF